MKETETILQGIFDIEPPTRASANIFEQHSLPVIAVALIAVGLGICVIYLFWRRYFSQRGKARRYLNALRKNYELQQFDNHYTVFLLADILRQGLHLQQLRNSILLLEKSESQLPRWRIFLDNLSVARYSKVGYEPARVMQLLDEAEYWLRRWPRVNK